MNHHIEKLPLRAPEVVMNIDRLGSMHQSRLSFMRELVRKLMSEEWQIKPAIFELDDQGFGTVVYTIDTPSQRYSYALFSNYLADEDRNDRVIADKWDVTMALCIGDIDSIQLSELKANVPLQELGRFHSWVMVLSRGNKSSRNFDYVVEQLANGQQPDVSWLIQVGYLYRTTAVYGSGKFGMADWQKVKMQCPEFASPFSAEMFNCFMLRHFSLVQAEYLAKVESPVKAVSLQPEIKRYFGIGNSTGLGMAPFLIRHPKLISRWILVREQAIARAVAQGAATETSLTTLIQIMRKARLHILQTIVPDEDQFSRNSLLSHEIKALVQWLESTEYLSNNNNWESLVGHAYKTVSLETQELLNSILLELQPELSHAAYSDVDEANVFEPQVQVAEIRELIKENYAWALELDFTRKNANHYFWYRSEEKMEPRLGQRFFEPGAHKEMPLTIARMVRSCYDLLKQYRDDDTVADIAIQAPQLAGLITRIQTMSEEYYGEIRINSADISMRPMDLLRCKLSFFGVSKFDPKSKLWVRNTMFQGAPIIDDIGDEFHDNWYFPVAPACET